MDFSLMNMLYFVGKINYFQSGQPYKGMFKVFLNTIRSVQMPQNSVSARFQES